MLDIPVEIKDLFKHDGVHKNFRLSFPDGEMEDITNDSIVEDSVSFTESVCSKETLKFGLYESPVLEAECICEKNIKGCTIDAGIEIDVSLLIDENGDCPVPYEERDDVPFPFYRIPYGRFVVDSCKRSSDHFNLRKIEAYGLITTNEWEWNPTFKAIIEYSSWYAKEDIYLGYSDIKRLFDPLWASMNGRVPLVSMKSQGRTSTKRGQFTEPGGNDYDCYVYVRGYHEPPPILGEIVTARAKGIDMFRETKKEVLEILKKYGRSQQLSRTSPGYSIDIFDFFQPLVYAHVPKGYSQVTSSTSSETAVISKEDKVVILPLKSTFQSFPLFLMGDFSGSTMYRGFCNDYYMGGEGYLEGAYNNTPNMFVPTRVQVYVIGEGYVYDSGEKEGTDIEYTVSYFTRATEESVVITPNKKAKIDVYKGVVGSSAITSSTRTDYKYILPYNLKELIEGYLEINAEYGGYSRAGFFAEKKLEQLSANIYPSEDIYPSDDLFPRTQGVERVEKSRYSEVLCEDTFTKKYSKVTCTFKNKNGEDDYAEYVIVDVDEIDSYGKRVHDPNDYQEYSLSENKFIASKTFSTETIYSFCQRVGEAIRDIQYMPLSMTMKGLPYLECGDALRVHTKYGTYPTYILRRTLKGVQHLTDSIESL